MMTPAMPAKTPPTTMESSRRTVSLASRDAASAPSGMRLSSHAAATMPENAPTLIKPAWPRLNSPEMPTVRFKDTAMTM